MGACGVRLSVGNPGLAADWHPTKNGKLTPFDVAAGSDEKAWWAGSCGHDWEAAIGNRDRGAVRNVIAIGAQSNEAFATSPLRNHHNRLENKLLAPPPRQNQEASL